MQFPAAQVRCFDGQPVRVSLLEGVTINSIASRNSRVILYTIIHLKMFLKLTSVYVMLFLF